jgi:hypothetical protein
MHPLDKVEEFYTIREKQRNHIIDETQAKRHLAQVVNSMSEADAVVITETFLENYPVVSALQRIYDTLQSTSAKARTTFGVKVKWKLLHTVSDILNDDLVAAEASKQTIEVPTPQVPVDNTAPHFDKFFS